ncbi:uncharacterized protein LY89DRAFT_667676 [Mollisia scopiformis]|uniref:Uncharacterized protein n=1 Tax=Mollisia scopiformis TaxID=149040 RepID=A0A194XFP7_MOLSC|nr:uncharacterized protein LY89DRAFT_667676 [Mollisia scopiformis]KUJ18597.1 hypothetical protein LY89DRAFT_667676 [Mollisia scopiformis]
MSSVGAGPGIGENLYLLLIGDDLRLLYSQILESTTPRDFEGALRHFLTTLASSLRKEASNKKERGAAKFLQWGIRNLAHRVAALMGIKIDDQSSTIPVSAAADAVDDDERSDMDDSDDDDNSNESDVQALENFILQSIAFKDFKASLLGLIPLAAEVNKHLPEYPDGAKRSDEVDEQVNFVKALQDGTQTPDLPWRKEVEISWQCSCGTIFQEYVIEYKKGAAQELANSFDTRASVDIEREAGAESYSESRTSDRSGRHSRLDVKTEEQHTMGSSTYRRKKEFILMCQESGKDTRLYHADISETLCDYSSYYVLHAQYYGRLKGSWTWLTLKEISSVKFVKFSLYWTTNVSIDSNDFGELPPYPSEDYSFAADTNPPVPRTALQHFIENPSHAPKHPRHRPRIPKKASGPLLLNKDLDLLPGYGIYIQERICWKKLVLIETAFATACIIFAVVWCIVKQGGIQDGFAIAGTGIAYATIFLGASQVVPRSHW